MDVESEFALMVKYQRTIESKSVLTDHSSNDRALYGLYNVVQPYPTWEEYLVGYDFWEGELIKESSDIVELEKLQDQRRVKQKTPDRERLGVLS